MIIICIGTIKNKIQAVLEELLFEKFLEKDESETVVEDE